MTNAKRFTLAAAALLLAACNETPTAQLGAPSAASFEVGGNTLGSGNLMDPDEPSSSNTGQTEDGPSAQPSEGAERGTGAFGSGG